MNLNLVIVANAWHGDLRANIHIEWKNEISNYGMQVLWPIIH